MNQAWTLHPLGDAAILIEFGTVIREDILAKVQQGMAMLEQSPFPGLVECVPSYTTLTVYYDPVSVASWTNASLLDYIVVRDSQHTEPIQDHTPHLEHIHIDNSATNVDDDLLLDTLWRSTPYDRVCAWLDALLSRIAVAADNLKAEHTVVEIPVCYGGDYGPDLAHVAAHNGLTEQEVIALHSGGDYLVYTLGFAPGFPYLGGLSKQLATPRRDTPRVRIPAGSVGIAGMQTGIYPLETPGGWQLIGRTPLSLFRPHRQPPALVSSGNRLVFRPISEQQYVELYEQDTRMNLPDSIHKSGEEME